jgi:hypothetical protein
MVKNYFRRDSSASFGELHVFLQNPQNLKLLERYCAREFSSENINLWKDLNKFSEKKEIPIDNFKKIMRNYILPFSSFEVNLPSFFFYFFKFNLFNNFI